MKKRYVTFEPWHGQLNNTRMCFEVALVFSHLLGRTLVISETSYRRIGQHSDGRWPPVHPSDIYDFRVLMDAFSIESGPAFSRASRQCATSSTLTVSIPAQIAFVYPPPLPLPGSKHDRQLAAFSAGRKVATFPYDYNDYERLHLKPMLEHFYTFFFLPSEDDRRVKRLIRDHLVFRAEIQEIAARAIARLPSFHAAHIRRGDFHRSYPSQILEPRIVLSNILKVVPPGSTLYLATDETDRIYFSEFGRHYDIRFFRDLATGYLGDLPVEWIAAAEQLICVESESFVGTRLSTFSGYITRLRGYRRKQNLGIYFTDGSATESTMALKPTPQFSWLLSLQNTPLWGREYKEAWEF